MLPQVRKAAKAGCTEIEVADIIGISYNTLIDWQTRYPKFLKAMELGKSQSTKRVKRALFHRAVGYSHDAVKIFNDKGEPVIVPYREHVPPDTNAAIFWLKNRKPDEWQDRTTTELAGSVTLVAQTLIAARSRVLAARASDAVLEAQIEPSTDPDEE